MPSTVTQPRPTRRLITFKAAAEHLDCTVRTVSRYVASGRLTAYRIGDRMLRVDQAEVDALAVPVAPHEVSA